ncbi:MAG TPA: D-tyrosyl-tRNA(Tyr) deacylase [Acholeplasmatales bacterium]|jgi:D-tyrosyl-tRNA(Tyr) deacylase|nr:D-tyrosyl-tRNA(Tyr) deacylase [Bacilli bacterium]MBS6561949.1 D-tyrosyl-tRNA(Tyr) deacylase [Staphylococcus sp.]CDC68607.1 d-tyrosyl-tRNA(Tyr) deacylase [Staphylococcus sp. CAG:324]HAR57645.1 D-tyrosyl-tRNA(Tyr) deacylase [Acholeplasmatales bacterium]
MRVIIQRVLKADCIVNKEIVSSIHHGMMILVGFTHTDSEKEIEQMALKIAKLRIFEDSNGKMNLSIQDVGGSILSISQFTLYANSKEGNRPSFIQAMNPKIASELYEKFNQKINSLGIPLVSGIFGADMKLDMICDGPVTIHLEY